MLLNLRNKPHYGNKCPPTSAIKDVKVCKQLPAGHGLFTNNYPYYSTTSTPFSGNNITFGTKSLTFDSYLRLSFSIKPAIHQSQEVAHMVAAAPSLLSRLTSGPQSRHHLALTTHTTYGRLQLSLFREGETFYGQHAKMQKENKAKKGHNLRLYPVRKNDWERK
ncbi:hypothetical protein AVEN_190085-1 [Araneus ventricosus]|uniref:Uncharacterized protein n=1 Tax=Araneus ventricosus TaxID=182803 RepID=A0A4Y2B388_ARAVE|nr:hypothetical protein AVEN_147486-1 [Araneus ventricosus]GBL86513.1 hypothetical protein AVEN_190085-1 [Araneus ventricosus]